jgi:molybdate transport system substrate-binding protein
MEINMKKHAQRILLGLLLMFGSLSFCNASEIQVYAAASLTDALNEIGQQYEQATGNHVIFNFAASNVLARQIEQGAPADIVFSADEAKMDSLLNNNLILPETRTSLLSNTLAIVLPVDSKLSFFSGIDLLQVKGHIVVAEPHSVPAGIYAKEYLEKIGIWSKIIDRLVPTENVRAALVAVELGNADAGIVYKTDAEISKRVKIAYEVPTSEGPKISYPMAVVSTTKNPEAAKKLLLYMQGEYAVAIFKKYGFLIQQ